jgi:hypothetical protein
MHIYRVPTVELALRLQPKTDGQGAVKGCRRIETQRRGQLQID